MDANLIKNPRLSKRERLLLASGWTEEPSRAKGLAKVDHHTLMLGKWFRLPWSCVIGPPSQHGGFSLYKAQTIATVEQCSMTIPLTNWTERTPKETFRNGRMDPFLADTGCTHGWKKWNWHTCAPSVRCWGHCKYGELQSGNRLPKVWNGSVAETGQYFLNVQPDIK